MPAKEDGPARFLDKWAMGRGSQTALTNQGDCRDKQSHGRLSSEVGIGRSCRRPVRETGSKFNASNHQGCNGYTRGRD